MIQFFARNFRRAYRIPAIIFYMFARGTAALWAFRKKDKNDRCRSARIVTAQTQLWARGLLRLLGVHYTLDGDLKKVDAEGGLLISNHQSYLDILVMPPPRGCVSRRIRGSAPGCFSAGMWDCPIPSGSTGVHRGKHGRRWRNSVLRSGWIKWH